MKGVFIAPFSGFLSTGTTDGVVGSWCTAALGCGEYASVATNTYAL